MKKDQQTVVGDSVMLRGEEFVKSPVYLQIGLNLLGFIVQFVHQDYLTLKDAG